MATNKTIRGDGGQAFGLPTRMVEALEEVLSAGRVVAITWPSLGRYGAHETLANLGLLRAARGRTHTTYLMSDQGREYLASHRGAPTPEEE